MAEVLFVDNGTLWETDGTTAGTQQVSSATVVNPNFIDVDGRLFFTAGNQQRSNVFPGPNDEVWTTDGTSAGTQELASNLFQDTTNTLFPTGILGRAALNGTLFFAASDAGQGGITHGVELWQSDGTTAGTHMVKDIDSHYADSSYPSNLFAFDGKLFFSASDGTHASGLWTTDGSAAGTQLVDPTLHISPQNFTVLNGALYFDAVNGQYQLWKTDGTAAGTQEIFGGLAPIKQIVVAGTKMIINDGDLWASDGTSAGTQMIASNAASFAGNGVAQVTPVGSETFFVAKDGTHGLQLWDTDGTSAGTQEITLVNTATTTPGLNPGILTAVGAKLFFSGTDGTHGPQLWVSDGTAAGTQELTTVTSGNSGLSPTYLTNVNGTLFFVGEGGPDGIQLCTSDGTSAGTHEVTHFPATANNAPPGGDPFRSIGLNSLTAIGSKLYFVANDGTGEHAFVTDGTTTTTTELTSGTASGAFFALPVAAPTPPHIVIPPGSAEASFDTTQDLTLDLTQADQPHSFSLSGNDTIIAGAAAASITATAGNDLVSVDASATGGMNFVGQAGNDTINAAAGANSLAGGNGSDVFNLTGGNEFVKLGSGTASIQVTGGDDTIQAAQGTSTISAGNTPLLLGVLGGTHQLNLSDGAAVILDVGGSSTVSASNSPAAPMIGVFGGNHQLNMGTGGDTVFGVGGNATINGGTGINAVDLVTGSLQVNAGSGITELFVNGGDNTALLQSNGGPVLVSGFDPAHLHFVIASHINGNVFTDPSQIPTTHTADGSLLMDLGAGANGEEQVLLVGVGSIPSSAITLV